MNPCAICGSDTSHGRGVLAVCIECDMVLRRAHDDVQAALYARLRLRCPATGDGAGLLLTHRVVLDAPALDHALVAYTTGVGEALVVQDALLHRPAASGADRLHAERLRHPVAVAS